jgi:hypothetical protein
MIPVKKPDGLATLRDPSDDDRCRIITTDLGALEWAESIPRRFRWLDFIDALATPVASEALPEVLGVIIEQPLKDKASTYREAKKLWGFEPEDCDAWRVAMAVVFLRLGSTRDLDECDADGNPIKLVIVPPGQRTGRAAARASLWAMQDALRHERLEQFGNPLTRIENGIEVEAKRPMRRTYKGLYQDQLNPGAEPSQAEYRHRLNSFKRAESGT